MLTTYSHLSGQNPLRVAVALPGDPTATRCGQKVISFQRGGEWFPVRDNLCVAGVLSEAIPPERGGIGDVSGRNHPCLLRDDSLRETVNAGAAVRGFRYAQPPG